MDTQKAISVLSDVLRKAKSYFEAQSKNDDIQTLECIEKDMNLPPSQPHE